MHVILTHEQADFDALASLLGAQLLDEKAIPVLPARLNRNLRAFLTIYGAELPFVDRRDLPPGPVERITLVDTQSLVSVRGAQPNTVIQVIDHHPARPDLPGEWGVWSEETGANATLLVEALQTRGAELSVVQATLLLLGIYEDTGSLTYSRTTARDVRAAAFLIEQGASLNIAGGYLNHPLSLEQEMLYRELLEHAETHTIQGHTAVIASADARGLNEELSTIAHKLRNLLDPDSLFLLIHTRGGVQLIARSTNDYINVAQVAAHFGGGGHNRAAAALIHDQEVEAVRQELLGVLPAVIRPAVTVAQIMSSGPQVLPPDTPAGEAAQRMQRYGYEGYPVVENGQIVGLLTRRAVDRAISHKLNLPARSLMQAGSYSVRPDDSIERLQAVMTDSGWGQVPVVHPESGEIIGIVTRTDLIKTLSQQNGIRGRQKLGDRLEKALPPARLALLKVIARAARQQGAALYIVGGFVRDLLLDRPSLDVDLVVEGDAISLSHALKKVYPGRFTTHGRFGTAKWHLTQVRPELARILAAELSQPLDPQDFPDFLDLVSARTEFYTHPSALPTVERGGIKLDLHRRDFTINTLALRLDGRHYGELHDYWGGLDDLRKGLVRVLHSISFVDDPTRMLRAVRYEQRNSFQIEERTLQLLMEARPLLHRVSGERIRHELDHIIDEPGAIAILARLQELGLLAEIHKALAWDEWLAGVFTRLPDDPPEAPWQAAGGLGSISFRRALAYAAWLIRLPGEQAGELLDRLAFPRSLSQALLQAGSLHQALPSLAERPPSQVVARLEGIPHLALYAAWLCAEAPASRLVLERYIHEWQAISPTVNGNTLRALGLPPGPRYNRILNAVRNAWLDGQVTDSAGEAALLRRLMQADDR